MTREDKFKKEYQFALDLENYMEFYNGYLKGVRSGIKFADENPNWHKYPEDKPNEDKDYLVYLEDLNYGDSIEIYEYSTKEGGFGYITANGLGLVEWKSTDGCVKAWIELPEPSKFD